MRKQQLNEREILKQLDGLKKLVEGKETVNEESDRIHAKAKRIADKFSNIANGTYDELLTIDEMKSILKKNKLKFNRLNILISKILFDENNNGTFSIEYDEFQTLYDTAYAVIEYIDYKGFTDAEVLKELM